MQRWRCLPRSAKGATPGATAGDQSLLDFTAAVEREAGHEAGELVRAWAGGAPAPGGPEPSR